jgi:signal peptidase I
VGEAIVYRRADETHVHRLVAAGEDRVAVRGRKLVVNGVTLARRPLCDVQLEMGAGKVSEEGLGKRRYAIQHLDVAIGDRLSERDEEVLAPEQMFVVGDFRDNSADSRFFGASEQSAYVGRALYIIWSDDWSRIGRSLSTDQPVTAKDYCR